MIFTHVVFGENGRISVDNRLDMWIILWITTPFSRDIRVFSDISGWDRTVDNCVREPCFAFCDGIVRTRVEKAKILSDSGVI